MRYVTAVVLAVVRKGSRAVGMVPQMQRMPGYLRSLLGLLAQAGSGPLIRMTAAVAIRNCVLTHRNWTRTMKEVLDPQHTVILEDDKKFMRDNILEVAMTLSEKPLIKTLAEAIVVMVEDEYITKWPGFLPAVEANLARVSELTRLHNILLVVRKVAKQYEYYGSQVLGWECMHFQVWVLVE